MKKVSLIIIIFSSLFSQSILRDDFNNLDNWTPLYFDKIEAHTYYSIEKNNTTGSVLNATSDGSASGLIWEKTFNVNDAPVLRWKWKVSNVYAKGNAKTKSGDDYPIRIYVIFEYEPKTAGFWESALYESAKLIYGEYPPHSSLNYIWANRNHNETVIPNSYTDKAQMILLQKGVKHVGDWMVEEVDILEDYQRTFGENPPPRASLAIMNDSDNTGETAVAWLDYIELR